MTTISIKEFRKLVPQKEESIHKQFTDWLKLQHPKLIFRTDLGGIRIPIGQAVKYKNLQSSRAYPDVFIAYPCGGFSGLFLELKKDDFKMHKRDGSFLNDHVKEQYAMIVRLNLLGYAAYFATGFEKAKTLTENYLSK
jgi:hypothetical protein